jgi:hypothetical protein
MQPIPFGCNDIVESPMFVSKRARAAPQTREVILISGVV